MWSDLRTGVPRLDAYDKRIINGEHIRFTAGTTICDGRYLNHHGSKTAHAARK